MKKLTDENGVPTVAGAQAMFAAMDEARANREWREAEAQNRREKICDEVEAALPLREPKVAPEVSVCVAMAMARKCSTDALLQVLVERSEGDEHAEATAAELAEVERAECITDVVPAQNAMCTDRALAMLHKLAREVAARRAMASVMRPSVERTPETVLRAMLKAYEADALESMTDAFAGKSYPAAGRDAEDLAEIVRRTLALHLAGATAMIEPPGEFTWQMLIDYRARLAGLRPLDAPPMHGTDECEAYVARLTSAERPAAPAPAESNSYCPGGEGGQRAPLRRGTTLLACPTCCRENLRAPGARIGDEDGAVPRHRPSKDRVAQAAALAAANERAMRRSEES